MAHFGLLADNKSIVVGGTQRITTPDGYIIPLDIVDELPYMTMTYPTDEEMETLQWLTMPSMMMTRASLEPMMATTMLLSTSINTLPLQGVHPI